MEKAYLILGNGMIFAGDRIGSKNDSVGELVFTTGMVGYIETLTDPSYAGQIVIQTFPIIGNYGVIENDFEGKTAVNGYIVREICDSPSNFRCQYELNKFLIDNNIPGICNIDTRQLTKILREEGVMNAKITNTLPYDEEHILDISDIDEFAVEGVVKDVSCKVAYTVNSKTLHKYNIVLIDYGAKANIIRSLQSRGCNVTIVPHDTSAEEIIAMKPDGIMLSNGPGDPQENVYCVEQIKKLIGKVPIFGICLGHQLTALALGGQTIKLKYGHRGGNQPVRMTNSHRTYITSQNHGYAVVADSLKGIGVQTYINANDGSCEGMIYPDKSCFTVQFHPEACSGPKDTGFLFDEFIELIERFKSNA